VKPVVFHREAIEEFNEAISFYEKRSAGLGVDLKVRVEKAVWLISEFPTRYSFLRTTGFRAFRLKRFPYLVIYFELPEVIWIAAVASERQHPDYWRERKLSE